MEKNIKIKRKRDVINWVKMLYILYYVLYDVS